MENLNKSQFKEFLELYVLNSYFIFDGEIYLQQDGVGMGLPLEPRICQCIYGLLCGNLGEWMSTWFQAKFSTEDMRMIVSLYSEVEIKLKSFMCI